MLTHDSRVRIAPGVVFNEVQGEMVLLNTTTGKYYGLDAVASRIWHLLRQEADLGQVLSRLLGEFDATVDRLWADLTALVDELIVKGLIEVDGHDRGQ